MRFPLVLLLSLAFASPVSAARPEPHDADELKGVYVGTYRCMQGVTGVDMIVYRAPIGDLEVLLNIYPIPGSPRVPHGVIHYVEPTLQLVGIQFNKSEWLLKAQGYTVPPLLIGQDRNLDMAASFRSGSRSFPGCDTFKLKKVDVPPEAFAAFEKDPKGWQQAMVKGDDYPYPTGFRNLTTKQLESRYMTGEQVRELVTGKTLIDTAIIPPNDRTALRDQPPYEMYFQPDGQLFTKREKNMMRTRAHWEIVSDMLCFPGAYIPCARYERTDGGFIIRTYTGDFQNGHNKGSIIIADGDPRGIVEEVSRYMPKEPPRVTDTDTGDTSAPKPNQKKAGGLLSPSLQ